MSEYFDFAFLDGLNTADQPPNIDGFSLDDVDQFLNLGPATPPQASTPSDHSIASNTVNSPQAEPIQPEIQVSNTFNLNANHDSAPPNTIIASVDHIFFAVHHHRLLACSINNFGGYLHPNAQPTSEKLISFLAEEPSDVVNVILHAVYNIPCDNYSPTLECLSTSLATFDKYGLIPLERFVSRGTPLFTTILNRAVVSPIETYALAASHALEDLAVSASSYTLHVRLHLLPQILVDRMGTRYMQRLYKLHGDRMDSLRELLDRKLFPHLATPTCSIEKRQVVSRALQLAGKQVMYDASPAMTRSGIENIMRGVAESVACEDCKKAVNDHIKDISTQWMILNRTI